MRNNKQIEKYFKSALEAVKIYLRVENEANKSSVILEKEFKGYAASFGAAMRTSGLIPTLAFYTDINNTKKRFRFLKAIAYILNEVEDSKIEDEDDGLLLAVVDDINDQSKWSKNISNASVALKLAIRNFPDNSKSD